MRLLSGVLAVLLFAASTTAASTTSAVGVPAATQANAVNQVWTFGRTVQGRPLIAYRLGERSSPNVAVFLATMHGDESGPAKILKNLMAGARIRDAIIWVVPDVNPDGYVRGIRQNAHGVDLNRNFPRDWVRRTGTYNSGPYGASEPETRAVMHFLDVVNPGTVVSFHQPLYGVDTSYPKTRSLATKLVSLLELPAKVFDCGTGCHGTLTQWFNAKHRGAALTVEYGRPMTDRQIYQTGPRGLLTAIGATR